MCPRPAVSVVMPAYNVAEYVEASIRSAFAQTFSDLEVIVVDDGSTDSTAAIVERLQHTWPDRLRLVRQENQGLASARNAAMRAARGDFFALLDSDDVLAPGFLAAQMRILEQDPRVDIVTGNANYLGGQLDGRPARPHPDRRPHPDLASILADERAVFIMSVFRRRVYETIGGFTADFRTNEDYDYWLRAAAAGCIFRRNSEPLGGYRVRAESLSADEVRMVRGILAVYRHFRPSLAAGCREIRILDRQVRRFEVELFGALARTGVRPASPALSERDFLRGLVALHRADIKTGAAAALARYIPHAFDRVRALRRQSGAPADHVAGGQADNAAAGGASGDRAGKDYWDGVWEHVDLPPDVDPQSRSIWAHRDQGFHRFFEAHLRERGPGASLLELGCACSAWLPYFARQFGCRISGLDYSERGAMQASERLRRLGIPADIRCTDLFKPPADWLGAFDVVVWFGVAEHFEDTAGAIRAASAYLKPGGLLITEVPNMVGFSGWLQRWFNRPVFDIHVPLDCPQLTAHHKAAGLDIVEGRYIVPTDFGVVNLETLPPGLALRIKEQTMHALRLLSGCIWWLDRRIGPLRPGRLTSGFVIVAARRPRAAAS